MKFGVNALIWTANFTEENIRLLAQVRDYGFDGVELPLFQPEGYPAKAIRRAMEDHGLEVTACTVIPGGTSLFHPDESVREKAIEHVRRVVAVLAELGGKLLGGPIFSPVGYLPGRRRTEEEWRVAIDSYHELLPALEQHDVTIALEPLNRFETFFLNTAFDGVALCNAVNHPRLGLLIDTFHANIEEKDIGAAYRMAGRHLKHVHTCENDRGIPGSGHVEWREVFAALRELRYDGWLTIESFGFNIEAISAAAAIWRDLAPTPEAIAWEGLAFLQRMAAETGLVR